MKHEQRTYRRFYLLATWAFALATVALWFPVSWESAANGPGTVIHVDFGVLRPVRATWNASADGFWLAFSDLRVGAWVLSLVLTAAAILAARQTYRQSRLTDSPVAPLGQPG